MWQPVITAPDDEPVLVWVVNDSAKTAAADIGYKDVAGNQYWWLTLGGMPIEEDDYRVTHWMPLPEPPK
jgi:hypothetical protein